MNCFKNCPPAAVVLSFALLGCGESAEQPAPLRLRLFDRMAEAEWRGINDDRAIPMPAVVTTYDFDDSVPDHIWYGRATRSQVSFGEGIGAIDATAGIRGAGLRLGPGVTEDRSSAVVMVPVQGLARVRVSGRVQLADNPEADNSSTREVLRIVEHSTAKADPTRRSRWSRRPAQRVSRRLDPSGWDRFDVSWITKSDTRAIELQLLHRSGGDEAAVTRFDEISVESTPLSAGQVYDQVRQHYLPEDGNAEATPWRLRVDLNSADGKRRDDVRDAILLPPPARLALPVRMPAAATMPVLRFHYGMAREAHDTDGDGARIVVSFIADDGTQIDIGAVETDPKYDRRERPWQVARFDVRRCGGQTGRLVFSSVDLPGDGRDVLDAVVIATPRIEPAAVGSPAPNVLLIGVDTLRADKMQVFGYSRANTPHLRKLAAEGVRFASTRSQAPWTLPSFSSILTSLYPSRHGAGRGGHDEWTAIDPATTSIAEVLSRVGYQTQGIVSNGLISPHYGLDQGFESYQSAWAMESVERDTGSVAAFIDSHRTTPWLLFWHIMDPHLPYSTADSFREEFTDKEYDGRFARGRRGPSVPFSVLDPRPGRRWFAHEGPPPAPELTAADRRFVHDYYDAEIAETDAAVGQVLQAVRDSGQWDRTIVAFVADHGEGLGDHGHYHHGYTLFEDQVHIPMLLRIPGVHAGEVIERPVAAIDLAPTILGALGLQPPEFFQGVDRLAPDAPRDDAYFIEYPTYDSSALKGWVLGKYKYLHDPLFHTEALYDFEQDPTERDNVLAAHPDVAARARAEMNAFRWEELQKGRFHLRLRGKTGKRLVIAVTTDDLFDANFITSPMRPEGDFTMDLERQHLTLDTVLDGDDLEFVFWGRGTSMGYSITLDGDAVPLQLAGAASAPTPVEVARATIPVAAGDDLPWPAEGQAVLWLEAGVSQVLPVLLSPDEIERLAQLGYTK